MLSAPHAACTVDRGKSDNSYVGVTVLVSYTSEVAILVVATVSVVSSYRTGTSVLVDTVLSVMVATLP